MLIDGSFAEFKYIGGDALPIPYIILSNLKQNQHLKPQQPEQPEQPQVQQQETEAFVFNNVNYEGDK